MDKNEMKNKISMALKDPILQQGFEIICKENAELNYQKQARSIAENAVVELSRKNAEAKEIIRELFHYIPSWTGKENDKPRVYAMPDELRAKAEQFLSEVEK